MAVLVPTKDDGINLPGYVAEKLIRRGNGDAALLYIALLRTHGVLQPAALAKDLQWEKTRVDLAEAVLRELGLILPDAHEVPPEPADVCPDYSRDEIADQLEKSREFRGLTTQVERILGKQLNTPDLKALLGLYDYLGLPADVIYLLVNHCATRVARKHGEGRKPTMRQIEKEGYAWAKKELLDVPSAMAYIDKYEAMARSFPEYMRVLQMGNRVPVAGEEKYMAAWHEMGFPPESVEIAYEKTIMRNHQMHWSYCNGILNNWHKAGLHTPEEILRNDHPMRNGGRTQKSSAAADSDLNKYVRAMHKDGK